MRPGLSQRGFSLLETLAVTGIAGALGFGAYGALNTRGPALTVATREIEGSLDEAFTLARASGQAVEVSASSARDLGHLPVSLPRTVRWGLPPGVPLPPHMDSTLRAAATGEAHPAITVTPRHTATATVWFLNDGGDALCIRVNDRGHVTELRWRASRGRWGRA
jgi:type II secretory pathway pseudopilin PulG